MELLFHYTTASGLLGIIGERNFRVTHFRFLNDLSEGSLLDSGLRQVYAEEVERFVQANRNRIDIAAIEGRFASISQFAQAEAEVAFTAIFGEHERLAPSFVLSLCEHTSERERENGLLSQWRGYGENGGYCLVFNKQRFEDAILAEKDLHKNCNIVIQKVRYISTPEDSDLRPFRDIIRSIVPKLVDDQQDRLGDDLGKLYGPLISILPFLKNEGFSEENEYRVLVSVFARAKDPKAEKPVEIMFRERAGILVPYIHLFQNHPHDWLANCIERIIVGPGHDSDRRQRGVERFLEQKGIKATITRSIIPFVG